MDDSIHIYTTTWLPEDHISELNNILEGIPVDDVENKLVKYVVENIEPCGWDAVWQPLDERAKDLHQEDDSKFDSFIVEVKHVCLGTLEAHIVITDGLIRGIKSGNVNNCPVGKSTKAPLVQLYPLTNQENPHVDIAGTANVVEQVRFFYDHIWLPWDAEEEFCCYDEGLISERMKLYQDAISNQIPDGVCEEMTLVVTKAKSIKLQIDEQKLTDEEDSDGVEHDHNLAHLIKLHNALQELKSRYLYLRDPALREIAAHNKRLGRRNLIESFNSEENDSDIFLVCSSCSPEEFISTVNGLPQLLKGLPGISKDAKIKTFPFLQLTLDSCKMGDTIVLLPGRYSLSHLGDLAKGGTICGLEGLVEIVGCSDTGDVMLDLHPESDFTLRSVELLPLKSQSAIVVHSGDLLMENCSIIDCSVGVTLLSKGACKIVNCTIQSPSLHSIICRSGSKLTVSGLPENNLLQGPVLIEEGAEVVQENRVEKNQKPVHYSDE